MRPVIDSVNQGDALRALAEGFELAGEKSFLLAGERFEAGTTAARQTRQLTGLETLIETELTVQLYHHFYARPYTGRVEGSYPPVAADPEFVSALSKHNPGDDCWNRGWLVIRPLGDGTALCRKGDALRRVRAGECRHALGPGVGLRAGASVELFCPKESLEQQPDFYFAYGSEPLPESDPSHTVRFYWNVGAEGASVLLREIVGTLNLWRLPFSFKTLADPASYDRTDAAVLYLERRYVPLSVDLIRRVARECRSFLSDELPALTRPFEPGVGAAETPRSGGSFGFHRMRLVASGLLAAADRPVEARLDSIARAFSLEGYDLERAHLNPRSEELPW